MVVGALTCWALLHFVDDLRGSQINMSHSLIQNLMLYESELEVIKNESAMEVTKNVYWFGLSTIVGYLMPNPVYTYILNI